MSIPIVKKDTLYAVYRDLEISIKGEKTFVRDALLKMQEENPVLFNSIIVYIGMHSRDKEEKANMSLCAAAVYKLLCLQDEADELKRMLDES